MEKMLPKVLQKESDINSATWKNNTQNSGNILNDRFSSEQKKMRTIHSNWRETGWY